MGSVYRLPGKPGVPACRYRQRNIVERLIGWLKECRCVFARYEKTAVNFSGMIKMAFVQRYLKILAP